MNLLQTIKTLFSKSEKNFFILFLSYEIRNVGSNMLGVFSAFFVYLQFGQSLKMTLAYFLISFAVMILILPLGGRMVSLLGPKKSIIIGSVCLMLSNISFIFWSSDLYLWMFVNIVFLTLSRVLFRMPFRINLALNTTTGNRGFEIGSIRSILSLLNIFLPFMAGLTINFFGFTGLFIVTTFFYLLSIIPLLNLSTTKLDYSYSYMETFLKCFSKAYIKDFFIHFLEGCETIFSLIIWPIIIVLTFNNDFEFLGIFTSLTLIATFFINLIIGKLSDKDQNHKILKAGSFLYGFGWLLKLFAISDINIFLAIVYQNISESIMKTPYESYWYNKEADKGDEIGGYIVIREIAIYSGKVFMAFILIILLTYFNATPKDTMIIGFVCFAIIGLLVGKNTVFFKWDNINSR